MINLELYRIFVVVANELNITRASEKLNVSQPAVTKQIKNLENLLNVTLFERSNLGMKLTSDGNKLYFKIKDAIELICKAEEDFLDNRIIKLGTRNMILTKIFSRGITKFYNLYPSERIDIKMYNIEEMLEKLNNGILDVVLTKKVDDSKYGNLKYISLGSLHEVFITKKGAKFESKVFSREELINQTIYINNLNGNPISIRILEKIFNIDDLKNKSNFIPITSTSMIEMIKKEEKIGFTTKEFIEDEILHNQIAIVKTDFEIEPTEYGIYYNKNNHFKALNNLIKIITEECSID